MSILKTSKPASKLIIGAALGLALAGCDEASMPEFMKSKDAPDAAVTVPAAKSVKTVTKDVEAPEVFQKSGKSLWDGRPSLGGVWVAHPTTKQPERVIIKNSVTGKFVIGALFRRERDNPGPEFQLSSDAAEAIGALAGSPTDISVTAMRTKEVPVEPIATPEEITIGSTPDDVKPVSEPSTIATTSLDPAKPAAKPIGNAPNTAIKPMPRPSQIAAVKPAAAAKPAAPKASGSARFVQMGFFSVESNAKATLASLKANGISGQIVPGDSNGKKFWRVLAGPANSKSQQATLLQKVKSMGFGDAYLVKG